MDVKFPLLASVSVSFTFKGVRKTEIFYPILGAPKVSLKPAFLSFYSYSPLQVSAKFTRTEIETSEYAPLAPTFGVVKSSLLGGFIKLVHTYVVEEEYPRLYLITTRSTIPPKLSPPRIVLLRTKLNVMRAKVPLLGITACVPEYAVDYDYGLTPQLFADFLTKTDLDLFGFRLMELYERNVNFQIWGWKAIKTPKGYFFMKIE